MPDKIVNIHGHQLRRLDLVLTVAAGLALALAFWALTQRSKERGAAIRTVCAQIKSLRVSLVDVLTASERASLDHRGRDLSPKEKSALDRQIRMFYGPQIDRVRPIHCP
jgi:hypothetical protein